MGVDAKLPVYLWRTAIGKASADVRPLTRFVCQTLSDFMDFGDIAKGCFPSVKTLMRATGLSNRAIATHIEAARVAGFIDVEREIGRDGRFKRTIYYPRFPAEFQVSGTHPDRPREGRSRGPREAEARHRVKLTTGDRVSDVHAYQSKTTNPTTETRSRAKVETFFEGRCRQEICLSRLEASFDRWVSYARRIDSDAAKTIERAGLIFVDTRDPTEGSPLPRLLPSSLDAQESASANVRAKTARRRAKNS